jgi:hypothetical protein
MEEQIRRLEVRIQRERYRQEELIRELQNLYRRNFISNRMCRTVSDYVALLRDHFRTPENPLTRLPSMRRRFNDFNDTVRALLNTDPPFQGDSSND